MEESINELNKNLKKANCCARNAAAEVKKVRVKENKKCDKCSITI